MPNLDPWVNQNENMTTKTINKFENHLLSIKTERQKMIHPNSHPTYNERHQKSIEIIDWTLEKYNSVDILILYLRMYLAFIIRNLNFNSH